MALGEPDKAAPLLGDDSLAAIDPPTLAKGAAGLAAKGPQMAAKVYARLTSEFRPDADCASTP